jgi:hypothetical protein
MRGGSVVPGAILFILRAAPYRQLGAESGLVTAAREQTHGG